MTPRSVAFGRMATARASTKRAALSGGKSAGFAAKLSDVRCLPLMPVDAETRSRPELATFHELKETFVESGLDIAEGDLLVLGGVEYPVRAVEEWPWSDGSTFLRVLVEQLKR